MIRTIIDVEEANILLRSYQNAYAQLWLYGITHKRLAIKLSVSHLKEVAFIIGVSCEHVNGPFSWKRANFVIVEDKVHSSEKITKIIDRQIGFELITSGGFSVVQGYESEFGSSFENFLIDNR